MFDTCHLEASSAPCHTLLTQFPLAFRDLATLQREYPELLQVIKKLELKEQDPNFSLVNGVLHCRYRFDRKRKVVVPMATVPVLFNYYHTSSLGGYLGVFKTIHKIRKNFIWKAMDNDIH
jgi:hypothetical protein